MTVSWPWCGRTSLPQSNGATSCGSSPSGAPPALEPAPVDACREKPNGNNTDVAYGSGKPFWLPKRGITVGCRIDLLAPVQTALPHDNHNNALTARPPLTRDNATHVRSSVACNRGEARGRESRACPKHRATG